MSKSPAKMLGFMRLFTCVVSLVLLACPNLSTAEGNSTLPLAVIAKHGSANPSPLLPTEIKVEEDGKEVNNLELTRRQEEEPLLWIVVLDASNSQKDEFEIKRKAAIDVVRSVVGPKDRVLGITFDTVVEVEQEGPEKVIELFKNARFGGGSAVFDALYLGSKLSVKLSPALASSVMIVFTDGDDNMSHVPAKEAITKLQQDGVACFPMFLDATNSSPQGSTFLQDLAERTGGALLSFKKNQNAASVLKQWEPTLRRRFLVSYSMAESTPAVESKSKTFVQHRIKIKSDRKDLIFLYPRQRIEQIAK